MIICVNETCGQPRQSSFIITSSAIKLVVCASRRRRSIDGEGSACPCFSRARQEANRAKSLVDIQPASSGGRGRKKENDNLLPFPKYPLGEKRNV